jgi:hypothetical protein
VPKSVRTILLPIIVIWIIVVITGFYWGHQYILIPPVIGFVRTVFRLGTVILIFLAALGIGWPIARLLKLNFSSRSEAFIFLEGLGLCALALLTMGLGLIGALNKVILWPLTLIVSTITIFGLWREHQRNRFHFSFDRASLSRIDYFFLAFTGIVLFLGLQLALTPPIGWDGLSTHLVFVRDILNAGDLVPVQVSPGRIAGHMLFIWAMGLGGEVLPQLLSYGVGLLVVAAVAIFANKTFGRRTAILTMAILVSVEVFIINAGWPYADVVVGLFSFLAVMALINWQFNETGTRPWLIIAAIFGVFAGHTKLNGMFIYPVLVTGTILGLYWHRGHWKTRLLDIVLAIAIAVLLSLAWTGAENMVISDQASSIGSIPDRALNLASGNGLERVISRAALYVRVLWEMTIIGQQGAVLYDGTISPMFLLLLPVLLLLRDKPRIIWSLIIIAIVELAAWLIFPREYYQNRHLILAYPIFSILAAYTIKRFDEFDLQWFSLSGFFRLVLVLVFALQIFSLLVWWQGINPLGYLLGLQSKDEFLSANLNGGTSPGYYSMMQQIEEELPPDSVVGVMMPEPRTYYCPVDCIRDPFSLTASLSDMTEASREANLTHILVSENGIDYWIDFYSDDSARQANWQQFETTLNQFMSTSGELRLEQDESFFLYELELDS